MVGQRENQTKKRKTKGPQAPNHKAKKQRGETSTRERHNKQKKNACLNRSPTPTKKAKTRKNKKGCRQKACSPKRDAKLSHKDVAS